MRGLRIWIGGAAVVAALGLLAAVTMGPEEDTAPPKPAVAAARPAPVPAPRPPRAVDYALVDARLKRLMQDDAMVGLAVGIVEDGQITYLRGYGETVAGTGDPVTADTVFRWASVSKGVASTLVARLAADGKLSLDDPVSRYAASLRLPGGNEARATVADVLSHRVGVHGNANDPPLEDGGDPRYLRSTLATLPLICPVGTCFSYQNVAYDAASEIVEKVTGRTYADVADAQLFAPLGMKSASVSLPGLMSSPSWARPHDGAGRPQPRGLSQAYYRVPAAGGVNSSIRDLARWMQAQMGEAPRAVPPAILATVHTPRVATPRENRRQRKFADRISGATYALGWRNYDYVGNRVVTHHGGISGYRATMMFDPVKRSGIVALWNSGSGQPWGLDYEVMDMIYGLDRRDWMGLDTPEGQPPVPLSPVPLSSVPPSPVASASLAQIGR
jgi:beta-lactamase class C